MTAIQPGSAVCLHIPTMPVCRTGTVIAEQRIPPSMQQQVQGRMFRVLSRGAGAWIVVHERFMERDEELAEAVRGFRMP